MMQLIKNIKNLPNYSTLCELTASYTNKVNKNSNFTSLREQSRKNALLKYNLPEHETKAASFPETYSFERYTITDIDLTSRLENELNIKKASARLQVLMPGQLTLEHLDDLDLGYFNPVEDDLASITFSEIEKQRFKKDPYYARRFLIMLDDWKPGQGIMFGTEVFTNWKKGDTVTWDWVNDVHSTFNTGFWPRPLIRVTGIIND